MIIRTAGSEDKEAIWRILEPVIRAGETYPLPRDMERDAALAYWLAPQHEVHVAVENSEIVGAPIICARTMRAAARMSPIAATWSPATRPAAASLGRCARIRSRARKNAASAPCSSIS